MITNAVVALLLSAAQPIAVRYPLGTLHGFPSMSDSSGTVIADGELTQEVSGRRVVVVIRWKFADGRRVVENDEFTAGTTLSQDRFTWVESAAGEEQRRFEVDFTSGKASSGVRDPKGHVEWEHERLDLPRGRSFTGYGAALAVSQVELAPDARAEITFVAFTAKPRTVNLQIRRSGEEVDVPVEGRAVRCVHYTLHPDLPFPLRLFAHPKDAHLWFTRSSPPALVRAEENLVTKDDPVVVIDVTPRGAARAHAAAGRAQRR